MQPHSNEFDELVSIAISGFHVVTTALGDVGCQGDGVGNAVHAEARQEAKVARCYGLGMKKNKCYMIRNIRNIIGNPEGKNVPNGNVLQITNNWLL